MPKSCWLHPKHIGTNNVLDVPRNCGILSKQELEITENYDATSLTQAIISKKFSCVQVAEAFCKRAAIATQLVHILIF